jgi:ribulose bisphosphate carboxylase small subunit
MSLHVHPHATVPYGSSLASGSVEEAIRSSLSRAFPLTGDHKDDPRFRQLLNAMKRRRTEDSLG